MHQGDSNKPRKWTDDELLVVFRLYCHTPFGKLHARNPEIIALARCIGRTPAAVAMKACNFASLDPHQQARDIKALGNTSRADRALWDAFLNDSETIALTAETAYAQLHDATAIPKSESSEMLARLRRDAISPPPSTPNQPRSQSPFEGGAGACPCEASQRRRVFGGGGCSAVGLPGEHGTTAGKETIPHSEFPIPLSDDPTERDTLIKARLVQSFFRNAVLTAYDTRCALTGIAHPELLTASHIIPWHTDPKRRADPRNGLCLNPLHDRAFDRGLMTFDEQLCVVFSPAIHEAQLPPWFIETEGWLLLLPRRFQPDAEALAYHRECVFQG
jgi:hypothetical protein